MLQYEVGILLMWGRELHLLQCEHGPRGAAGSKDTARRSLFSLPHVGILAL